jgi:ABC-type antimicrobial peptide transport system permease subunit
METLPHLRKGEAEGMNQIIALLLGTISGLGFGLFMSAELFRMLDIKNLWWVAAGAVLGIAMACAIIAYNQSKL